MSRYQGLKISLLLGAIALGSATLAAIDALAYGANHNLVAPVHLTAHATDGESTYDQALITIDKSDGGRSQGHMDYPTCSLSITCQVQIDIDATLPIEPKSRSIQISQLAEELSDRRELPQPHPPKVSM